VRAIFNEENETRKMRRDQTYETIIFSSHLILSVLPSTKKDAILRLR